MSSQTPRKGFLSRAYDLFTPGTPLTNEPTIDYNDTIYSYKQDDLSLHNHKYGSIQDDNDSDIELGDDLNRIYEQMNENSTKLSSRYSLPDDFPGKFADRSRFKPDRLFNSDDVFLNSTQDSFRKSTSLPRVNRRSYESEDRPQARYSSHFDRRPTDGSVYAHYSDYPYLPESYTSIPRSYSGLNRAETNYANPYSSTKDFGLGDTVELPARRRAVLPDDFSRRYRNRTNGFKDINIYNDPIDEKLKNLEEEVNMESITKLNTKFNEVDINRHSAQQVTEILDAIKRNNKTLSQLDDLIDMTNETDENLPSKYEKLKQEMRQELLTHQAFYKSYIALVNKYRALKKAAPSAIQNDKLISRINLIKSSTKENSVKLICNNLLNDLKSNISEIEALKSELEAAKNQIRELQNRP